MSARCFVHSRTSRDHAVHGNARPVLYYRRRAQLLWGTQVHGLDLGIEDIPFDVGGVFISQFDIFAALVAAGMVAILSAFFRYTRIGLGFRAVADDQFAALAVGLKLPWIWASVWAAAGLVALVAGLLWGARLGCNSRCRWWCSKRCRCSFSAASILLSERSSEAWSSALLKKLAEVYIGEYFGGGIEGWFAYVVALAFLLIRPSGLFGQKLVERV